jgi:1-phosphofructokinase/tagatose 6-phosphate kinase
MIITVTLNPAIDKTLAVPNFRLGRRHRAVEQTSMAGGKGVNVARALKTLGQPVIATGLAGGPTGARIVEQLTEEAILNDFVHIRDESRMSTAVVDPTDGTQTEINERGPTISNAEAEIFADKLFYLAKGAAMCVFCGSLPRGVPSDFYATLITEVNRLGVTTVLDSEGEAFTLGTRAGPTLVTPNVNEAEELVGHEFGEEQDQIAALREIANMGARDAVITSDIGCVALVGEGTAQQVVRARVAPREVVSRIGAGDVFVAGYVSALYGGALRRRLRGRVGLALRGRRDRSP